VRVIDRDGLTASCTTVNATVGWEGIKQVRETPHFFLFFTTPACAIHVPKRAIADVPGLRTWLNATADRAGLAALRVDPARS
jgi:hypothetical protein